MTWKTLESAIALAANIAKDYLKYKTSDTKEKKALENDIEQNPENFVDSENTSIAKEAADLLDNDKRNDEVNNDALRQEDAEWANQLREKYNSQYQTEAPEDLFEGLTEDDVEWVSQMLDEVMNSGNKPKEEIDPDWLEQTQANDAYAMGQEENNYSPPEQFKQVGAFLGGKPSTIEDVDYTVEDVPNEESIEEEPRQEQEQEQAEQPNEDQEEDETTKRRNNFLDKFRRSISVNPSSGSFTAEETKSETKSETNKGGAIGKGIGSNINGQSGGVGVNVSLEKSNDEKEIELKEEKEQRNIEKELHYDDVPIEQMSSVNVPGANNGNTGDDKSIKVPNAHSSFSVKKNELKGKTGHAYGTNKVRLNKGNDNNDLEEILKSLDDYSIFEPLIIENINDEILVNGHPLKMVSDGTLKHIEEVLNGKQ